MSFPVSPGVRVIMGDELNFVLVWSDFLSEQCHSKTQTLYDDLILDNSATF